MFYGVAVHIYLPFVKMAKRRRGRGDRKRDLRVKYIAADEYLRKMKRAGRKNCPDYSSLPEQ